MIWSLSPWVKRLTLSHNKTEKLYVCKTFAMKISLENVPDLSSAFWSHLWSVFTRTAMREQTIVPRHASACYRIWNSPNVKTKRLIFSKMNTSEKNIDTNWDSHCLARLDKKSLCWVCTWGFFFFKSWCAMSQTAQQHSLLSYKVKGSGL